MAMNRLQEMATISRGKMSPFPTPLEVQVQPTNKCNAHCVFCWLHNHTPTSVELPDEKWLELADEICALDIPKVCICGGGEPLLRGRLVLQMMEKFSRAGMDGDLITNGTLISEHLANRLVQLHWKSVQVSIQAPSAKVNDRIMDREGTFDRALRGIKNINRAKKLHKSDLPKLAMRLVITRDNVSSIPEFIKFAHAHEVSRVFIRMDNNTKMDAPVWQEERLLIRDSLERAKEMAAKLDLSLELQLDQGQLFSTKETKGDSSQDQDEPQHTVHEKTEAQRSHCPLPFSELVIFANGMASPCCNFVRWQQKSPEESKGIMEDLRHSTIGQAWQNGFSLLRSSMFSEDKMCSICQTCSLDMRHHRAEWPESFFHQRFRHLRKKKRFREGIRFGLEQLNDYPQNATLYHYIGDFHMELGEYGESIAHLSRAVSLDPKIEWTRFSLGKCFYLTDKYEKAEKAFKDNLKLTSDKLSHYYSWLFLARTARSMNDVKGCLEALQSLKGFSDLMENEISPELEFLFSRGEHDALIDILATLDCAGRGSGNARFLLGRCLLEKQRYAKALESFRECLETHPFSSIILGALCCQMLQEPEALSDLLTAAKHGASPDDGLRLGLEASFRHLKEHGHLRAGVRFGKRLIEEYPDLALLRHHLGELYMELGDYHSAIEHLTRAAELEPEGEWTRFSLGKCYYLIAEYDQAENVLKENLTMTSGRESHFHSLLFMAMAAHARGASEKCQDALAELREYDNMIKHCIPLEKDFLHGLQSQDMLPLWMVEGVQG